LEAGEDRCGEPTDISFRQIARAANDKGLAWECVSTRDSHDKWVLDKVACKPLHERGIPIHVSIAEVCCSNPPLSDRIAGIV